MALPPLTDAQIESDQPLDEALMKEGLRDRDIWNKSSGDDGGGGGIDQNVEKFRTKLSGAVGHSHDGTGDEGANIDTDGIAAGAVWDPAMIGDDQVTTAKIAGTTMQTANFAANSVRPDEMTGTMGWPVSGSQAYDTEAAPVEDWEDYFQGDVAKVANPKGRIGVICNFKATGAVPQVECFVKDIQASWIYLGIAFRVYGGIPSTGTWGWDFQIV
jgi:hypothetical protein